MNEKGFAVDIDETLAQTNLFWARHHIQTYGNPENLTAEEIIRKYVFVKDVPYWQITEAHEWIEAQLYSNDAKLEIPAITEAIEVLYSIPVKCYLTNRPESTVEGTKKWLKKHNFPEREIIASNKGLDWKAKKLEKMFPEVLGIIEDNIDLIKYLQSNYNGIIFLYSNLQYINSQLKVLLCPTWADIKKEIQQFI